MQIERASTYRSTLEALVSAHTEHATELLFVKDVAAWGKLTGARTSGNPTATALLGISAQPWLIVIREDIDAQRIRSVLEAMELFESHNADVQQLATPERFLQHTVLHELAHLVLGVGNEKEELCNRWAFSRMPAMP